MGIAKQKKFEPQPLIAALTQALDGLGEIPTQVKYTPHYYQCISRIMSVVEELKKIEATDGTDKAAQAN